MSVFNYLSQPAPRNNRPVQTILLYITIVGLILAIFEPFQYRLSNFVQFEVLIGFLVVLIITLSIFFFLLPKIFTKFYASQEWTIGKNYLHYSILLLTSGILTFIYDYFLLGKHSLNECFNQDFFYILRWDMFAAITIGIIPTIIELFITQNRVLKQNLTEAKNLNQLLSGRNKASLKNTQSDEILLTGDTKESISLLPNEILYIESSGNYVDICYINHTEKHKIIRSTIKQMEEKLHLYNTLVRCHRAYIINIDHIINIEGNAQGYRLTLKDCLQEIPVSRTYMKELKEVLSYPKNLG